MDGRIFRRRTVPSNEINLNFVYLTDNITNLHRILIHLIEHGIISDDERQLINSETTDARRHDRLLSLIQRKNWPEPKTIFLHILRTTGNGHCADLIEKTVVNNLIQSSDLGPKWWPEEKTLPKAFLQRKNEECLLIDTLKNYLSGNASEGMAVITQQVAVSGLGGIGKTTTAIWFAQKYQADYDRILWIECGEKSLLKSFKKLARFLKLEDRHELDLSELAAGSFQSLKDFKCLLIFDNAECYIGNEGIKDVLPKSIENFDVLITSRNKQWGDANGDGEIPQFQMNVFHQNESVEFMKKHIKVLPENVDSQLKLLCDLLGNLPLAIQIAIATLNRQKPMKLGTYIDKILNTPEILHAEFDKYEHTINKTMKISLDLIKYHESTDGRKIGEIALRILSIFGFITPDNVEAKFFMAVETKRLTSLERIKSTLFGAEYQTAIFSKAEIDEAMNVLEVYSLITRNVISDDQYTLSIHRLLQQVIRYNIKNSKEQILSQILNCDGNLEYKLIPFSYADEKLQKKFPKIKAELVDKLKLSQLLRERRFKEAVELSRIIKSTLKNPVSKFNFAVCLKHSNELTESLIVFQRILDQINIHDSTHETITGYSTKMEIIESIHQLNKNIVLGQFFSIFLNANNVQGARNLVLAWKQVTLPMMPLNDLINFLNLMSLPNIILECHKKEKCITLRVETVNELTMKLGLHFWVVDENTQFHQDLQDLVLVNCKIFASKNHFLKAKNICMRHVNVGYKCNEDNQQEGALLFADDFFDFCKIKKLMFQYMQFEFRLNYAPKENVLTKNESICEWVWNKWVLSSLFVCQFDLTQTIPMTLTDITLEHCSIDISILPPALKKLTLNDCFLINRFKPNSVESKVYQSLEELSLINIFVEDMKHGEPCTPFDISHFITPILKKLKVNNFASKCVRLSISLNCLTSVESLHLAECALVLGRNICIAPTELTLKNVYVMNTRRKILHQVVVNKFVNFNAINFLCLTGMSIDFSEPVSMREIILRNANTINWTRGRWIVGKLSMFPSLGPTDMKIDQLVNMEADGDDTKTTKNPSIQIRKEELLKYCNSISGCKTIFGLADYINLINIDNINVEKLKIFQSLLKMGPGILTIFIPKYSADKWQSFIDRTISYWNNGHLVQISSLLQLIAHEDDARNYIIRKDNIWTNVLDTLAPYLHQLQTAGVVAICDFLPAINFKGAPWGDYSPNDRVKLYQMTRDYLTQHHGLSSLIWVWSMHPYGDMTEWKNYWPGDSYVDVASVFSSATLTSAKYETLLEMVGDKPISMQLTNYFPTPQLFVEQTRWTWLTAYYNDLKMTKSAKQYYNNVRANINTILNSPSVIHRGSQDMFKTLN